MSQRVSGNQTFHLAHVFKLGNDLIHNYKHSPHQWVNLVTSALEKLWYQ